MAEPIERDREMAREICQYIIEIPANDEFWSGQLAGEQMSVVALMVADARAEGKAEVRAELTAANSLNCEAEIAAILDGMEPHAKDLLSEQMRALCANIAEVCEAKGWRRAREACVQFVKTHQVASMSDGANVWSYLQEGSGGLSGETLAGGISALAEPPADGSGA